MNVESLILDMLYCNFFFFCMFVCVILCAASVGRLTVKVIIMGVVCELFVFKLVFLVPIARIGAVFILTSNSKTQFIYFSLNVRELEF